MTDKCPFTLEEKNYEKPTKQPRIVPYLLKAEKILTFFKMTPSKRPLNVHIVRDKKK